MSPDNEATHVPHDNSQVRSRIAGQEPANIAVVVDTARDTEVEFLEDVPGDLRKSRARVKYGDELPGGSTWDD